MIDVVLTLAVGAMSGATAAWCWQTSRRVAAQRVALEALEHRVAIVTEAHDALSRSSSEITETLFDHGRELEQLLRGANLPRYKRGA